MKTIEVVAAIIHHEGKYLATQRGYGDYKVGTNSPCHHMYMYRLKKRDFSKIKVVAKDRFGNEYTETKVTTGTDYSLVEY